MKKILFTLVCFVSLMSLTSCEEEDTRTLAELQGTWVLLNEDKTPADEKSLLTLEFIHDYLYVSGASHGQRPFTVTDEWYCYVNGESELVIYYYSYDSDGDETRDSYYLDLSFGYDHDELHLTYDPLLGSTKHYTFMRRNK